MFIINNLQCFFKVIKDVEMQYGYPYCVLTFQRYVKLVTDVTKPNNYLIGLHRKSFEIRQKFDDVFLFKL